ncbi:MAG TPA: flagellar filament capping protein FliD [Pseudomonadales bacterium]|jgi:flagellar hook-associated protein 2|nr:flagellar filament capping protein FliD [Pseudomonadales bacterium]HMW14457.1 flagellar filament capping protein FliD [Pseudomonadales bacterium]HMW82213.1 flagellar filament capping protein FliD [Pseudomonadales bacterium]HMY96072.1 flagellar filament capping protein FliD [Pseudomonadales bacterium]HMZ69897.1 flagellar filament capping protein FliD [Pseudomonadales bacterium]
MPSVLGVGSGLDLPGVVRSLVAAEGNAKAAILATEQSAVELKISSYGLLASAVNDFKGAISAMRNLTAGGGISATSSDSKVVSATATAAAVPGNYEVIASQLATSHRLISLSETNGTTALGGGTLTLSNGSGKSFNVTIAAALSGLNDIRDAINNSPDNFGVTASVVTTGTGSVLVLDGQGVGSDNAIKLTVADADTLNGDLSGLSRLAYDPLGSSGAGKNMTEDRAAVDASIKVNGVTLTNKSGNLFDKAIDGVTLTLNSTSLTPVTVKVAAKSADRNAIEQALNKFVTGYNTLLGKLNPMISYDAVQKQGGALLGESSARLLSQQLRTLLVTKVEGLPEGASSLSQIGLTSKRDGTLEINSTLLNSALNDHLDDTARLLASSGDPINQLHKLESTPFTAVTDPVGSGTLTIHQGSKSFDVTVTAGVNDKVSDLISAINQAATSNGVAVKASYRSLVGGGVALTLQSQSEGAAIRVTANDDDGNDSDAAGLSRLVFDPDGNALQMNQSQAASRSVAQGLVKSIDRMVDSYTGKSGIFSLKNSQLTESISRIEERRTALNRRLDQYQQSLARQFAALDGLVGKLQSTQSYLTNQFDMLSNLAKGSSK